MKTMTIGLHQQPYFEEGLALAVGYFDGFHLGHQALINEVKEKAEKYKLKTAVLSFNPNPLVTLGKMKEEHYITSLSDRQQILEKMGIDYFLILDFTKEVASMDPNDFVQMFIMGMNVKEVVCGFDFFFGSKGKGNGALLQTYTNFNTTIIGQVSKDEQKISTTRIVNLLEEGNIEEINRLLTRPFKITGEVVHGKRRGHSLGFPTANVDYGAYYLPRTGVYGVKVKYQQKEYIGMCNIGTNPTFNDIEHKTLEVNIFDFDKEIYGEIIEVSFYTHTRKETKFNGVEALIQQLHQDQEEIKAYFA